MIRTIRMMKGITPIENDGTRHKKGLITMYQAYSTNLVGTTGFEPVTSTTPR